MIVRPKPHWFRMLFVWRGSVLKDLLPRLGLIVILSVVAVLAHQNVLGRWRFEISLQPFTLLGIALAIFLGFRNGVCYDRFWEARKLWGSILNASRALSRQALTLSSWSSDDARRFVKGLSAFPHLLRHQLRDTDGLDDIRALVPSEWLDRLHAAHYRPAMLVLLLGEDLRNARRQGQLPEMLAPAMEANLDVLADIVGGCERILATPVPLGYSVLLHRTVYFYCALLPFGLAPAIGWLTPLFAAFVAYTFIALDVIADELEEPFGTDPNDLPLLGMSRTIADSLADLLGDAPPEESAETDPAYWISI